MDIYIIAIAFFILIITHAAALYAGWKMGIQRDKLYVEPVRPAKQKENDSYSYVDEIDMERLDWS